MEQIKHIAIATQDSLPQPLFQAVSYALDSLRTGRYYYPGGQDC